MSVQGTLCLFHAYLRTSLSGMCCMICAFFVCYRATDCQLNRMRTKQNQAGISLQSFAWCERVQGTLCLFRAYLRTSLSGMCCMICAFFVLPRAELYTNMPSGVFFLYTFLCSGGYAFARAHSRAQILKQYSKNVLQSRAYSGIINRV